MFFIHILDIKIDIGLLIWKNNIKVIKLKNSILSMGGSIHVGLNVFQYPGI